MPVPRSKHSQYFNEINEVAEGMGFEPTIGCYPYNGLANRRLQPLGHPSTDERVTAHAASVLGSRGRPVNLPYLIVRRTDAELALRLAAYRLPPSAASGAQAATASPVALN
jgi:hypothetical protein